MFGNKTTTQLSRCTRQFCKGICHQQRQRSTNQGKEWERVRSVLPWAVKLNKGGRALPLGKDTFGSLKSSKKGCAHASNWKLWYRLGPSDSNFITLARTVKLDNYKPQNIQNRDPPMSVHKDRDQKSCGRDETCL